MARKPQYSGPWKTIRREVLLRDDHRCQIKLEGCTQVAEEVDHILPVALGGEWFDKDNLRASCRACNLRRLRKAITKASRTW